MKRTFYLLIILCTILFHLRCSFYDNYFVATGYVADSKSRYPIVYAMVVLSACDDEMLTFSDSSGYFEISLSIFPDSSTSAVVTISKEGYKTDTWSDWWFSSLPDTFFLKRE